MKKATKILCCIALCCTLMLSALPLTGNISFLTPEAAAAEEGYYFYEVRNEKAEITDVNSAISGNITIPATLGGYPVTSIRSSAFDNCTGLTSILIPNSVTFIGNYAFHGCTGLKSVTIPDSVTSIGEGVFFGCSGLTAVTIPNSVTEIGDSAFYGCAALTSISIPASVTNIKYNAFEGCTNLASITIPDSVTNISSSAFSGTEYYNNNDNWENGLLYINNHLVSANKNISGTVNIKAGTKTISPSVFSNCGGLTSVTIPDSVTYIGSFAFSGCSGIKSIELPASVTNIDIHAFSECTGLTSITIPQSVTRLNEGIFRGCTGLKSITIPDSVTYIGSCAFEGTAYYNDTNNWKNGLLYMNNHLIEAKKDISGTVNIKPGTKIIASAAFHNCAGLTAVTIPNSVITIGYVSFSRCIGLTTITIPNSVTKIGESAFAECTGLTAVTIPNSVTSIGSCAFYACTNLESVTIPEKITELQFRTFDSCASLKSIKLPESLESIDQMVFMGCAISEITVPENVKYIGSNAFSESLEKITVLNPLAELSSEFVCKNTEIHGYTSSTAERYANANGNKFVIIPVTSIEFKDEENIILRNEVIFTLPETEASVLLIKAKGNAEITDKDGKAVSNDAPIVSGMTVTLRDKDGKVLDSKTVIVPCDNDGDGTVSSSDARTALRAAVGLDKLSDWQIAASDVEEPEKKEISSADARYILRAAVGLVSVKDWINEI
ncbi:MAG: leucine-rich repeat protein [Clostridia bacterium]|nr:leucine-rich repeat protein [Clostridia bacterium]